MKKIILSFILILFLFVLTGCTNKESDNNNNNNNNSNSTTEFSRTSTNTNNDTNANTISSENIVKNDKKEAPAQNPPKDSKEEKKEEEITSFSTKIYTKENNRQNNIGITISNLNETTVKSGNTFSFCNTVGKATTNKGYEKADVFDSHGNKTKGLGGGNCQVSSTLYNAVLKVPELEVTERHSHSNSVPYVAKGKDAAVAYGSYDLKFKNNTSNTIKIYASTDGKNVVIRITKLL